MTVPGPSGPPLIDSGMLEEALRELKVEHSKLLTMHQRINEMSGVASSPDRSVSATVDGRGEVVQVSFQGTKYRSMPAAQLGKLVTETIAAARRKAMDQLEEVVAPMLPPGLSPRDAVSGSMDITALMDELAAGLDVFREGVSTATGERRDSADAQ